MTSAEILLYVHGEVVRHYAERFDLPESRLAQAVYEGEKSPGAARQRLRLLKQDGVRLLGTGKLSPREEAGRLSKALGVAFGSLVNSRLVHVLVKPEGGHVEVGGFVMAWPERELAMMAAALVDEYQSGPHGPKVYGAPLARPLVHATTEADLRDHERFLGRDYGWRLIVGAFDCVAIFQWLLDLERYLDGEADLLDALAWARPDVVMDELAPLFHRVPETPRNLWRLDAIRKLIARSMEIKCLPALSESLWQRRDEVLAQLTEPVDASQEREADLCRRAGLPDPWAVPEGPAPEPMPEVEAMQRPPRIRRSSDKTKRPPEN